ncbi:signal peptidase I [Agromyces sp. NPDC049794]|uniref:signal peptidase I n=1 Tax=unclassified Agromyces TaxID=2639701 RepID=UPI0033DF5EBA
MASAELGWVVALVAVAAVAVGALLINRFVMFTTLVRSDSMRPALESGDLLLTTCVHRLERLRRGDIVVFRSRERGATLVKRLIGLPGERIGFGSGGVVHVNGEPLDEPYASASGTYRGAFEVPPGRYLVLGDNREASDDARSWAEPCLHGRDIRGVVRFRLLRRAARASERPVVDA